MGQFIVRILGPAKDYKGMGAAKDSKAPFLERFDWDAWDGKGAAYTTHDPKKAQVFSSGSEAFFYIRQPSPHVPEGWTEKEYCPLNLYAYSIEVLPGSE